MYVATRLSQLPETVLRLQIKLQNVSQHMAKGAAEESCKRTPARIFAIYNSHKICLLGHDTL